jgi:hypothetical protein
VAVWVGVLPVVKELLGFLQQGPLLSRVRHIAVCLEQGANIDRLAAPKLSMHGPVERELQGAPVQRQSRLPRRHGCVGEVWSSELDR